MHPTLRRTLLPTLVLLAALAASSLAVTPAEAARRHTRLLKSIPSKDTTLTGTPESLQLWFSERIDLAQSRVQLLGANERAIPLSAITRDDSRPDQPVVAKLMTDLAPGTYTVNWSAASGDGHPVRGGFRFTVKAP